MSKLTKRVLIGVVTFILAIGLCWYGGLEIFERGFGNAMALGYSGIAAVFAAFCPAIE